MIDKEHLEKLIAMGESLEREFKSDVRRLFTEKEIFEEVVALANTSGGVLILGVEDNGHISGAKPRHGTMTDPLKLQSAIFNNTVPSINTRVSVIGKDDIHILVIEVDPYPEICATAAGKCLRRAVGPDGKPQTIPFHPRDHLSRRIDLGLVDFSAFTLEGVSFENLDPLEFERLRQAIERLRGEHSLLELSNDDLAKALRLVESRDKKLIPNVAGLLLLGRRGVLEELIPTNEVFFQVLEGHEKNVKMNDCFRVPLLKTIEEIEMRFSSRNQEKEIDIGLVRLPVPDYSPISFREAVINALLHRDYTRQGATYIQFHENELSIANPGGFLEGITVENILVHEPKPRNPRLAEAFRRIGLVEQTGRGVDRIFEGQLRYGRPVPDYNRSDKENVRILLYGGQGSLQFAAFVYGQEKAGKPLTLEELLILNHLYFNRRIDSPAAGGLIQKGSAAALGILEKLVEKGFVEAKGERKGRIYVLSASMYKKLGNPSGFIRVMGYDHIDQEQMVMRFIDAYGRITRAQVADLCKLKDNQASKLLLRMRARKLIRINGNPPKGAYYTKI